MALERSRTFADLLREYRRAATMTQEQLAEHAGLSVRALRKLESGASVAPRRDTIDLLATALKLSAEKRTLLEASASRHRYLPGAVDDTTTTSQPGTQGPRPVNPAAVAVVGRTHELALLERHLTGKGPPLLVLAGEPGIGKSRLLQETIRQARGYGLTVIEGGCHRRSGQEPYAPLLAALASSLRSQSAVHVRSHLEGCSWLVRLLPELAESSLVPLPEWQLPPTQERRLMFAAVRRYLANLAGPSGTLLVLDDLQWAGQDALDLLAALLRTPDEPMGQHLRVVAAYRSTEVLPKDPLAVLLADLAREGLATAVELGRLTPEAADELATALFVDLPSSDWDEMQKQMVERTGGVPYFLVSWAQALQSQVNAEVPENERQGGDREYGLLPWTVTQSIRQRLALLPEAAHEVVNIVAVSGREAAISVLLMVATRSGLQQAEMLEALELAGQTGLLVEEEAGKSCAFAHDLIREVAVAELGAARRATLHRWVGEAILQATPPGREPPAAELAWHFARGGDPAHALPCALQAGEQAEAICAHAEAERHYQMALELSRELGDATHEAEVLERLAEVVYGTGRVDETLVLLEAAAELRQTAGNLDQFAFDIAHMTRPYTYLASSEDALARLRTLLTFLATQTNAMRSESSDREMREREREPRSTGMQMDVCKAVRQGDSPGAADSVALSDDLANLAERVAPLLSPRTAGIVYYSLAFCLVYHGRHVNAAPLAKSALSYAQAAADRWLQVRASVILALAFKYFGQPDQALATLETAYPVAQRAGEAKDLLGFCLVAGNHGELLFERGNFVEAEYHLRQSLEAAEQYGMPDFVAQSLCGLAEISLSSGVWEQTLNFCQRAAGIVHTFGFAAVSAVEISLLQCKIFLARGEAQAAQERLYAAIEQEEQQREHVNEPILVRLHATLAEADLLRVDAAAALARLEPWLDRTGPYEQGTTDLIPMMAWACLELGDEERASALLTECLAQARERHYRVLLADALRIQALLALSQGRWQDAEAALDEALALTRSMPYPYAEAKTLYVYGDLHAAQGNVERGRDHYEAALAILGRLGERLYAERVEQALAKVSRS